MHVRPATPDDEADIVAASMALARESEGRVPDEALLRAGVRAALARGHARYFVADDERIVGCLFVTTEWSDWTAGWYWWIQGVYVHPAHRGRGIYRALVAAVRQAARNAGDVRRLRLYVHRDNAAGTAAHVALGFRRTAYEILDAAL